MTIVMMIIGGVAVLILGVLLLSALDKRFYEVQGETVVDASAEKVWQILAVDFGDIADYTENVAKSTYTSAQQTGVGTMRHCDLKGGGFMDERISQWREHEAVEISIIDSSMPVEPNTKLLFELHPISPNQTRLTATGMYRLRYLGILSPIIGKGKFQELTDGLLNIAKVNAENL